MKRFQWVGIIVLSGLMIVASAMSSRPALGFGVTFFFLLFLAPMMWTPPDFLLFRSPTRLREIFLALFIATFAGLTLLSGGLLLQVAPLNPLSLPIASILFMPTLLLPVAFLRYRSAVRSHLACPDARTVDGMEAIVAKIESLATTLNLREPEALRISDPPVSPNTFGTFRRAVLTIPANLPTDLEALRTQISSVAGRTLDFVIMHELAHVKNRDYVLLIFGELYLNLLLRWWAPILAVGSISLAVYPGLSAPLSNILTIDGISVPAILILLIGAMYASILTIRREREFEADTIARQQFPEETCAEITRIHPALGSKSPFEFILDHFKGLDDVAASLALKHASFRASMGIVSRSRSAVGRAIDTLLSTHPGAAIRIENLHLDRLLFARLAIERGVFFGLFVGIVYVFCFVILGWFLTGQPYNTFQPYWGLASILILYPLIFLPIKVAGVIEAPLKSVSQNTLVVLFVSFVTAAIIGGLIGTPYWIHVIFIFLGAHAGVYMLTMIAIGQAVSGRGLHIPGATMPTCLPYAFAGYLILMAVTAIYTRIVDWRPWIP